MKQAGETGADKKTAHPSFPLYIRVEGARVVVVGAGRVAVRKVGSLLDYGANVAVIAPEAAEEIKKWALDEKVELFLRPYEQGDLKGALLAVAATPNRAVNEAVSEEARCLNILVNVVDAPDLCTCFVPSTLRRGKLQVAISTDGAAPGVARDVRRELERLFPEWWEPYLDVMADARMLVKQFAAEDAGRRAQLLEALGDPSLRVRFASGERPLADRVCAELFSEPANSTRGERT